MWAGVGRLQRLGPVKSVMEYKQMSRNWGLGKAVIKAFAPSDLLKLNPLKL
jgi:hypothetical protein